MIFTERLNLILYKEIKVSKLVTALIGVVVFVVLTALGAYVYIPLGFTPVPITLQTFFVLLCGAFLGRRFAPFSQSIYTVLGIAGVPIFSLGTAGLSKLLGPTGGYIIGFILCSYVVGRLFLRSYSILKILLIFCLGDVIILICGTMWLWFGIGFSFERALYLGFFPFIPGDLIKIVVATFICKGYLDIKGLHNLFPPLIK